MTGEVAASEALQDSVQRETQQYQVALEQAHAVQASSRDHCLSVCSEEEGLEALVVLRVGGPGWWCGGAAAPQRCGMETAFSAAYSWNGVLSTPTPQCRTVPRSAS